MGRHRVRQTLVLVLTGATVTSAFSRPPDDERDRHPPPRKFEFSFDALELGATPGGAQDVTFFRDRVTNGEIPHPAVFTPEGLFSEHDLPLMKADGCKQLLCMAGEATDAALIVQPEVRWLAQLGFDSGLSLATWKRPPLDLVAVVDKSGSMSGQPLSLVKESLLQIASQLRPDDRMTVVLYGDRAHVHMPATSGADKRQLAEAISAIESAGSTAMEEGLAVGYAAAREGRRGWRGTSRVMLFTDERPNVGATDAKSFMGMAEKASQDGIGLTTIGVGVQFGAELATKIASVRGGNLFYFADLTKMKQTFTEELDTMVTELAYDLELELTPSSGLAIAGVYGIPGQMLEWGADGIIKLRISTIFLSRKNGAIYVAFKSAGPDALPGPRPAAGVDLGSARVTYVAAAGGSREQSEVTFALVPPARASVGLARGLLLVDEATTLKRATALHHEQNDQEGAYQLVHAVASLLRQTSDPDLANERELTARLEATLAKLSGHQGEPPLPTDRPPVDPVNGLPRLQ